MSIKEETYCGLIIKAGCFEVGDAARYITSLLISRAGSADAALIELPVTHLLFASEVEALNATLAHGRLLVDTLICERIQR